MTWVSLTQLAEGLKSESQNFSEKFLNQDFSITWLLKFPPWKFIQYIWSCHPLQRNQLFQLHFRQYVYMHLSVHEECIVIDKLYYRIGFFHIYVRMHAFILLICFSENFDS